MGVASAAVLMIAGGAINSPALLLRSQVPDLYERLGTRTFLHLVVMSAAMMAQKVEGWQGHRSPSTAVDSRRLDLSDEHWREPAALDLLAWSTGWRRAW